MKNPSKKPLNVQISNESFDENEKQLKLLSNDEIDALKIGMSIIGSNVEVFDPNEAWIETFTGKRFTPLKPNINSICIEDISHSLSMLCRFSGHCKSFYSVAQHSVGVSYLCDEQYALQGLLHDASEAYLNDLPAPLKRSGLLKEYISAEKNLQTLIFKKYGIDEIEHQSVKKADMVMLATEARDLLIKRTDWVNKYNPVPFEIKPLNPEEAEKLFISRFKELCTLGH